MKEYRGFKYSSTRYLNKWRVIYPSGFSTFILANDENELCGLIDDVIEMFEG